MEVKILDPKIVTVVKNQIARIEDIIKAHGGGVEIIEASEQQLVLNLQGHCAGCPLASMTFGVVLNKYLREALPSIKEIKYVQN